MADDQESASSRMPGLIQDFVAQLQGITEKLENLAGDRLPQVPSPMSLPGLRNLPLPGSVSAEQLHAIASSVAAQRQSIQALQAQLSAFDGQLAVLERIIGPLTEWSGRWAEIEERLLGTRRAAGDEESSPGP